MLSLIHSPIWDAKKTPTLILNTVWKSTDDVSKITISIMDDPDIAECFLTLPIEECYLNLPNASAVDSPLDMETISEK